MLKKRDFGVVICEAEVLNADERSRTSTGYAHRHLKPARLPVPPHPRTMPILASFRYPVKILLELQKLLKKFYFFL
jgi:hypothetical protein